jgi:ribokinase
MEDVSELIVNSLNVIDNFIAGVPDSKQTWHEVLDESKQPEIIVVGSANCDLFAYCNKLPQCGETIFGNNFEKNWGGKGANQAVQISRLGINCMFVGKVGNDSNGSEYISQLIKEGIHTKNIFKSNTQSTGTAIITVSKEGDNTIIIIPGSNNELNINDVNEIINDHSINFAKCLVIQNEIPIDVSLEAVKIAKNNGLITIFNPAPVSNDLDEIISLCDIIIPNETELASLTLLPTTTDFEVEIAAKSLLLNSGCKIVIVTLGSRGACVVSCNDNNKECSSDIEIKFMKIIQKDIVCIDTVGAGDSFVGSFASCYVRGNDLYKSIEKALFIATLSVTRYGSQKSYFLNNEIEESYRPFEINYIKSLQLHENNGFTNINLSDNEDIYDEIETV